MAGSFLRATYCTAGGLSDWIARLKAMRTDSHNNPTALTTDVAAEARLILGVDYTRGDSFTYTANGVVHTLFTARLIGDPVGITSRLIDKIGFYTSTGSARWTYMGKFPHFIWLQFTPAQKRDVIGYMYANEGGTTMRHLFPNFGKP